MKRLVARLLRSDEGQDLIEYGLLVGIITVGAIAFITTVGRRWPTTSTLSAPPCHSGRHGSLPGEGAKAS